MSVPVTILGGYLGTGKTTLLNHLLKHAEGRRLALIINDFGAINIDAELISEQTDKQINLTNGCVCCGMSAGFDEALETLLARKPPPDHIIVEASGVADVISLSQYGHHPGLVLDGVIVVADAETVRAKARDKYVASTVQRQLKGADLILLNKTDLVSTEQQIAVEDWLADLSPGTPVITTERCEVPTALLLGLRSDTAATNAPDAAPEAPPGDPDRSPAHHHEAYVTWHFHHDAALPRANVDDFLAALPDAALRAKGFILMTPGERYLLQRVGRRQTLARTDTNGGTELVVIGLAGQLDTDALDRLAAIMTD